MAKTNTKSVEKTINASKEKKVNQQILGIEESRKKPNTINLPYLSTPSNVTNCLNRVKEASTPTRVNGDFVNNTLNIKGGSGTAIAPFLKKIGLVSSDGTPTELYKKYRNQSTGGHAIAEAIKIGYKPLLENNEYFFKLNDSTLKDCIINVTGLDNDDNIVKLIFATLKNLFEFASFDQIADGENDNNFDTSDLATENKSEVTPPLLKKTDFNLSYTINLNLPATSDQAVFNAIFKSLREYILSNGK